jgi:hypothetical protein
LFIIIKAIKPTAIETTAVGFFIYQKIEEAGEDKKRGGITRGGKILFLAAVCSAARKKSSKSFY